VKRLLPLFASLLAGCQCGVTGLEEKRFVCGNDGECASGFVCVDRVCVREGAAAGGSATAGGAATAGGSAGGDSGGSGGESGGGSSAGGSSAGGSSAGGSSAGGSSAGGSSAGGVAGPMPDTLVFTTNPPSAPLLAGRCFPATVEARLAGAATPVPAAVTVNLTPTLTERARFYSDATCDTQVTSVPMTAGASTASFYVRPLSGGTTTITAAAPFDDAMQTFTAVGAVRRGSCTMQGQTTTADGGTNNGDTFVQCTITPAHQSLANTFLVFQTENPASGPNSSAVRCRINGLNNIQCRRQNDSSDAVIRWQTFESPTGLSVYRSSSNSCPDAGTVLTLGGSVNTASSFVTWSSSSTGTLFDDEDMALARLVGPDQVRFEVDVGASGVCNGYELQVVDLAGLTVLSGGESTAIAPGVASVTVGNLTAGSVDSVLLTQARTPIVAPPGPVSVCGLLVRGEVTTPTSLTFTRGNGSPLDAGNATDAIDSLYWQRLDFGGRARVQVRTEPVTSTSTTVTINMVDTSRTLVFGSGQISGGQATGECDSVSSYAGPGTASFELLSSTSVRVTRGRNSGDGRFTFYVVELVP